MPLWDKFTRKEVPQVKCLETHASHSQGDGAKFSMQSFGLALSQQGAALSPKQNVFISPLSIFLALAMTENGAAGETKAAMRKVLGLPTDGSEEAVNEYATALLKSLRSYGEAELAIANAVWVDVKSTIAPNFVQACQQTYAAAARTLNFNEACSATVINHWVSEQTRGKIPSIVTPNGIAGLPMILTNAIYFRGKFRIPFPKEATRPKVFYLAGGREREVPMMRIAGLYGSYRSGKKFEAAMLRYKDSGIVLYMLLPARGTSPEQILTEESVQEMLAAETSFELDLSMPRFTLDSSSDLRESLTRLGMGIAFQYPGADFSALGAPPFCIGEVLHKTRLEVDEEGTVAAAATAMEMLGSPSMLHRIKRKILVFDRPFAVLLRDMRTGTLVLVGVVYEP